MTHSLIPTVEKVALFLSYCKKREYPSLRASLDPLGLANVRSHHDLYGGCGGSSSDGSTIASSSSSSADDDMSILLRRYKSLLPNAQHIVPVGFRIEVIMWPDEKEHRDLVASRPSMTRLASYIQRMAHTDQIQNQKLWEQNNPKAAFSQEAPMSHQSWLNQARLTETNKAHPFVFLDIRGRWKIANHIYYWVILAARGKGIFSTFVSEIDLLDTKVGWFSPNRTLWTPLEQQRIRLLHFKRIKNIQIYDFHPDLLVVPELKSRMTKVEEEEVRAKIKKREASLAAHPYTSYSYMKQAVPFTMTETIRATTTTTESKTAATTAAIVAEDEFQTEDVYDEILPLLQEPLDLTEEDIKYYIEMLKIWQSVEKRYTDGNYSVIGIPTLDAHVDSMFRHQPERLAYISKMMLVATPPTTSTSSTLSSGTASSSGSSSK